MQQLKLVELLQVFFSSFNNILHIKKNNLIKFQGIITLINPI